MIAELMKGIEMIKLKLLMFAAGFCATESMLTGIFTVISSNGFLGSLLVSLVPSLAVGIWCAMTTEKDLREEEES